MTYYGIDWMATALALAASYLLGNQRGEGFRFFMLANICWMMVGLLASSPAIVTGNFLFLLINFRGARRWPKGGTTT